MSAKPDPFRTLTREIRTMKEQLRRLSNASPFSGSGMRVTAPDQMQVDGSLLVNGNLDVTGDFTLPAASIDDSWLANLTGWSAVTPDSGTAWSTSTSMVDKAATTVTVPSGKGYDTALVVAWGLVTFQDAAPNRFDCRCVIEGNNGPTLPNLANTVGQTTVLHSRSLAVTDGQVLNLSVQVLSAVATGGAAANTAVVGGVVLFRR